MTAKERAHREVKPKPRRKKVGGGPQYVICDGCGRTFSLEMMDRQKGVCKEFCAPAGVKQSGKALGYLAASSVSPGRIIVQNPLGSDRRSSPTAADIQRQGKEARGAEMVWRPGGSR